MELKTAYTKMLDRVKNKNNEDLKGIWKALHEADFCASDLWDPTGNINMDEWMEAIYSEISSRGLSGIYLN